MTENDDKLIAQFFEDYRQEIADNGFSKRVMRRLPNRIQRLNRIWSLICTTIGILFFWLCDGIDAIRIVTLNLFGCIIGATATIEATPCSPAIMIVAIFIIALISIYNLVTKIE